MYDEICTNYYKLGDGILVLRGVCEVYSEGMCASDCNYPCVAFEGEKFTMISYRPK